MQLYIHLPFCRSRCRYCDFYSTVHCDDPVIRRYCDALAGEWHLRNEVNTQTVETVFIGGGTPSVLSVSQWEYLYEVLLQKLSLVQGAEWTVECNPESFTDELADCLLSLGVTRLTFGVQTLNERERKLANRRGRAEEVLQVLERHSLDRFTSIGVDLIYGLPAQTLTSFSETLSTLLRNPRINHLSAYELTIAEGTPFGHHKKLLPFPAEDEVHEMMLLLFAAAAENGFEQYEISNFARKGHRCRHNIGYWNHVPYVGLGTAAHSFVEGVRSWNCPDLLKYCGNIENSILPVDAHEVLDAQMRAREMLFLGLRRPCGINEKVFTEMTGFDFSAWGDGRVLQRLVDEGFLIHHSSWWRPTEKGLINADYLARELF